jgi:hypothetical protein
LLLPLVKSMPVSLHAWRGDSLPERRDQLHADTVDLLLDWRESPEVMRGGRDQVIISQPGTAQVLKPCFSGVYSQAYR